MAELKSTIVTGDLSVSGDTNLGGDEVVQGNVTLYTSGTGNSPALIFQRGTLSDNYNDWQIQDRSGYLQFDQRGNGSTAFDNVAILQSTGFTVPQVTVSADPTANMQVATKQYVDNSITPSSATVTLSYQLWGSNVTLPITVTGMTSSAIVWVSPSPSSQTNIDNYNNAKLYCSAQATDSLTFTCTTTPTADIDVNVVWIK